MRKFKFRLQSYLDLKIAEKKNLEYQLAAILKEVYKHRNQINFDEGAIKYLLDKLNSSLSAGMLAGIASAVPDSVSIKRTNIELHERSIEELNIEVDKVKKKLYQKEAEIKVLEEMREKKFKEYKKKIEKKREEAREELTQIRKFYQEKEEWQKLNG